MKGSVELVAGILGVTRYTVYNYIDASRAKNGENQTAQKDREIFE
jgi:predicted transcriptional regulator YheO